MSNFSLNGVVIKNNVIRPAEAGAGIVILAGYTNTYAATNVVILGNTIYPSSTATNTTALSLNGLVYATVMNNVLQGGGTEGDFYINYSARSFVSLNTFSGNVNMSGTQLVERDDVWWQPGNEDTIKFTPTADGWYRVSSNRGGVAAAYAVSSDYWSNNATTDTEFWVRVSATTPIGELGLTRRGSLPYFTGAPTSGNVVAARIVNQWPDKFVDILVTNSAGAKPITVTAKGPFRGRMSTTPLPAPVPAAGTSIDLVF
jgi:hypothetical protein